MNDIIKLNSKGQDTNYLKKLKKPDNTESKTYVLKVSNPYLSIGETEGCKFISPSGGPMIIVGKKLSEADAVVKSIDFTVGYGYTITFV